MDVEPQPLGEHVLGDDQPVRDRDDDGSAEVESGRELLRLENADARVAERLPWRATRGASALAPRGRRVA